MSIHVHSDTQSVVLLYQYYSSVWDTDLLEATSGICICFSEWAISVAGHKSNIYYSSLFEQLHIICVNDVFF